jgi:hypothetical protein
VTLEAEYKNFKDVAEVDSENAFVIKHLKQCANDDRGT